MSNSSFLKFGYKAKFNETTTPKPLYAPYKSLRYPLDKQLYVLQSLFECGSKDRMLGSCQDVFFSPRISAHPDCSLNTIPTELLGLTSFAFCKLFLFNKVFICSPRGATYWTRSVSYRRNSKIAHFNSLLTVHVDRTCHMHNPIYVRRAHVQHISM